MLFNNTFLKTLYDLLMTNAKKDSKTEIWNEFIENQNYNNYKMFNTESTRINQLPPFCLAWFR